MPSDGRPRRFPFGKLFFAFLAAMILVGAAGTGALLAYQGRYTDRIYPNVTVDGVDIGGMDRAAAHAALEQGLARYGVGTVTVTAGDKTIQIPFSAANRRADVDTVLDQAFQVGRTGDSVSRVADGVGSLFTGTRLQPKVLLDDASLSAAVEAAAARVDAGMVDATAEATASGFTTTPAVEGQGLDRAALAAAIKTALADPAAPAALSVTGSLTAIDPDVTDADAAAAVTTAQAMARDVVLTVGKDNWKIPGSTVRPWITFGRDATGAYVPTVADDAPLETPSRPWPRRSTGARSRRPSPTADPRARSASRPARDGRTLDAAGTTALVVAALRARAAASAPATPPSVAIAVAVKQPKLTTEAAKKAAPKMRKISTWTTYYPVELAQRVRQQHLDPGPRDRRDGRRAGCHLRLVGGARARSTTPRSCAAATATAARSSTATPPRARRSRAASARRRRPSSTRSPGPATRSTSATTTTTSSTAIRPGWTPPSPPARRPCAGRTTRSTRSSSAGGDRPASSRSPCTPYR